MLKYESILEYYEPLCPPATDAQLAEAEVVLGVSLPPAYREFLKHMNGAVQRDYLVFNVPQLEQQLLSLLCGIGAEYDCNDLVKGTLEAWYWNLTDDLIVIGNDPGGNRVVLGVKEPHIGKVCYWDSSYSFESSDDDGNIYPVSDDFEAFMESLRPMESDTGPT